MLPFDLRERATGKTIQLSEKRFFDASEHILDYLDAMVTNGRYTSGSVLMASFSLVLLHRELFKKGE